MTSLPRPAATDTLGTSGFELDLILDAYADLIESLEATLAGFTAAGLALLDDADAAAQRSTLGLGTAATKTAGFGAGQVPLMHASAPGTPDGTKFLRDDGVLAVPAGSGATFAGAAAYRSSAQTINDATATALSFNTERFDSGSVWAIGAPTRFVAPSAGKYLAMGSCQLNAPNTPVRFYIDVYVNGSVVTGPRVEGPLTNGGFPGVAITALLNLSTSDYVEFFVYIDATGTTDTVGTVCSGAIAKVGS